MFDISCNPCSQEIAVVGGKNPPSRSITDAAMASMSDQERWGLSRWVGRVF
jgi:hypothetical protein